MTRLQKRHDELDRLVRGLYENFVSGILPEKQYRQLMKDITERYEWLVEVTKPYIFALQHFPEKVKEFFEKLIPQKERAEEKEQPTPTRKPKRWDDWER